MRPEQAAQNRAAQNRADQKQNRDMRLEFARKVYRFLLCTSCLFLVFCQGLCAAEYERKFPPFYGLLTSPLPDSVILALVGSTAVSVLGLVGSVPFSSAPLCSVWSL